MSNQIKDVLEAMHSAIGSVEDFQEGLDKWIQEEDAKALAMTDAQCQLLEKIANAPGEGFFKVLEVEWNHDLQRLMDNSWVWVCADYGKLLAEVEPRGLTALRKRRTQ